MASWHGFVAMLPHVEDEHLAVTVVREQRLRRDAGGRREELAERPALPPRVVSVEAVPVVEDQVAPKALRFCTFSWLCLSGMTKISL
jgi:hypothetical protein